MRALSMHPVYADAIACGEKCVENRTWQTDYRGKLLICASMFNDGKDFVRGHAICVADLYNITGKGKAYKWHLRDIMLIEPIPVKGKLHLFDVAEEVIPFAGTYDDLVAHWQELGLIR